MANRDGCKIPLVRTLSALRSVGFTVAFAIAFFAFASAEAQTHKGVNFQALIKKSSGELYETTGAAVRLQVLSPNNCVLLDEEHTNVDITGGSVTFAVGTGPRGGSDKGYSLADVFNNKITRTGLDQAGLTGSGGCSYTPSGHSQDARKLRMTINSGGETIIGDFSIRASAYAVESERLEGRAASDFVQINSTKNVTQAKVENFFDALTNGSSQGGVKWDGSNFVSYNPSSGAGFTAGSIPATAIASLPWSKLTSVPAGLTEIGGLTCADGKILKRAGGAWTCADETGGGGGGGTLTSLNGLTGSSQLFAVGTTGPAPGFNSTGSVHTLNIPMAATSGVTAGLLSKTDYDSFTGKLDATATFAGDVTGAYGATSVDRIKGKAVVPQAYSAGQILRYDGTNWENTSPAGAGLVDLSSTQTISGAKSFSNDLTLTTQKALRLGDSAGSEAISLRAPSSIAADYTLTLPLDDGTSGQVLTTDGSGVLSWSTPSGGGGGVTSVATGTGLTGGPITTTGTISIAAGGVSATELASDAVTTAKILNGAVTTPKLFTNPGANRIVATDGTTGATLAPLTCAIGEILKWTVTGWTCSTDSLGSVTSVGLSLPSIFDVTTATVTTSGTLTAALANQAANTVLAAPDGSSGTPSFRLLAAADVPNLAASKITTGTFATARLGSGTANSSAYLRGDGAWASLAAELTWSNLTSVPAGLTEIGGLTCADGKILKRAAGAWTCADETVGGTLSSLNGLNGSSQTFANGTSGLAPAFSSSGTVHTLNIPMASTASVTAGLISKTDYDAFAGKLDAGATFAGDVTGTYGATSVDRIKGKSIVPQTYAAGQILRYDGTNWENASPASAGLVDLTSAQSISGAKSFSSDLTLTTQKSLRLGDSAGGEAISLRAPSSIAADYTLTLPVDDGTSGQVLTTDGSGVLSWASPSSGGVTNVATGTGLTGGPITTTGTISIAAGGVSATELASDAVTSVKILDGAVTTPKLFANPGVNRIVATDSSTGATLEPLSCALGEILKWTSTGWDCATDADSGGVGDVTSVALSAPASVFTVSGSPITTSGTLALGLETQAANRVFAGPVSGGNAAPTFRALGINDIRSTNGGGAFLNAAGSCGVGEALTYLAPSDTIQCASVGVTSSQVTTALGFTPVNKAGDTMTGALALPSNGLTVGTSQLVVSSGKVGIGTTSPSYLLSLNGTGSDQTIAMERETTAATNGRSLTVQAGGATSGSTDRNGGDLYLSSGIATGNGGSDIIFNAAMGSQGAGTANRLPDSNQGKISGKYRSVAFGNGASATGLYSTSFGYNMTVSGGNSFGVSLVSGAGYTLSNANTMAIMGGTVGIDVLAPAEKLEVNGNVKATSFISTSDRRLKEDIRTMPGLSTLLRLRGVSWRWKESRQTDAGVIAQELEEVLPFAVVTDPRTGLKSVKYGALVAPLIESTKELYGICESHGDEIRRHDREIASLQDQINGLVGQNTELKQKMLSVESENEELKRRLEAIERRLGIGQ